MDLDGRVAVVTGAGGGLGEVVARGLAARGARVLVVDVDAEAAAGVAASLPTSGASLAADLSDPACVEQVAAAADGLGGVDVLVNNAGGWGSAGRQFPDADPGEWRAVLDLNLTVPMALTQRLLEPLSSGGGAVVNVSSSAGRGTGAYACPEYAVAKAGLVRFTTSLAGLGSSHGVRVSCVVPGWIGLPRAHEERAALPEEERPALVPPAVLADVVVDLAGDDEAAGRVVVVDGGMPLVIVDR